jgi:hypothetical protein
VASAFISLSESEWQLLKEELYHCSGIEVESTKQTLVGTTPYRIIHFTYEEFKDIYQMGFCVGLAYNEPEGSRGA